MRSLLCFSLLSFSALIASCGPTEGSLSFEGDDDDCAPATAQIAVHLRIEDSSGAPMTPSSVQFSYEEGEPQDAECFDEACTEWVTGYSDSAGSYSLTIELDEPFPNDPWCYFWARETVEIEVSQGECNLNTEQVAVELDAVVICADGDG